MNSLRIYSLSYNASLMCNKVDKLVKSSSLDLLPLEVAQRIHRKVEYRATLPQLLDKQLLAFHT